MKKIHLKKLALSGIFTGILLSNSLMAAEKGTEVQSLSSNAPDNNFHIMSEEELFQQLSPEGIKLYKSLNPEGKELAKYVASQSCYGNNLCKNLNACETDKNKCKGQGECKGKGKCAFTDKNEAIKVVAEKMAAKRRVAG